MPVPRGQLVLVVCASYGSGMAWHVCSSQNLPPKGGTPWRRPHVSIKQGTFSSALPGCLFACIALLRHLRLRQPEGLVTIVLARAHA